MGCHHIPNQESDGAEEVLGQSSGVLQCYTVSKKVMQPRKRSRQQDSRHIGWEAVLEGRWKRVASGEVRFCWCSYRRSGKL